MLLLSGVSSKAEVKLDFTTVDQLTYRYYQEKKWDSVIHIGKQALRQDIDYYYLRVRMGISYFEKGAYFPATTHLKRAREFNSADPVIAGYLYYAYLYSNRFEEAGLIKSTMTEMPDQHPGGIPGQHTSPYSGLITEVHAEGGYTISSDRSPENLGTLMENDSIYGEQDLYGNSSYFNTGLKLMVSKRIGLSLAYNFLNFSKTKYIQYGRGESHLESITDTSWGKNYNYTFPWVVYDTSFNYHIKQNEAHIGVSAILPWGIRIMPAFHWIHVSYNRIDPGFRMDTIQDTAFYTSVDNLYHTFPFALTTYSFNQKDTSFNNYIAALEVTKDEGIFRFGIHGSWSNLNLKKQKQIGVSLTCFPFGNLNFYGTTSATGFFQGKDKRLLVSQVLGVKITPWMWGEADFYYGDYTNANIFNGSIVYNNSDFIDYRAGASLVFVVGKHLRLSLNYQYFRKESQQLYYIKTQDPDTKEINEIPKFKNNPYNTNNLIGGISWKL